MRRCVVRSVVPETLLRNAGRGPDREAVQGLWPGRRASPRGGCSELELDSFLRFVQASHVPCLDIQAIWLPGHTSTLSNCRTRHQPRSASGTMVRTTRPPPEDWEPELTDLVMLTDYSQVDTLASWYKFVNFRAKTSPPLKRRTKARPRSDSGTMARTTRLPPRTLETKTQLPTPLLARSRMGLKLRMRWLKMKMLARARRRKAVRVLMQVHTHFPTPLIRTVRYISSCEPTASQLKRLQGSLLNGNWIFSFNLCW